MNSIGNTIFKNIFRTTRESFPMDILNLVPQQKNENKHILCRNYYVFTNLCLLWAKLAQRHKYLHFFSFEIQGNARYCIPNLIMIHCGENPFCHCLSGKLWKICTSSFQTHRSRKHSEGCQMGRDYEGGWKRGRE